MRTILHVDMDAFYASIEQRDHPEYRGNPVVIGSDPKAGQGRGIVATCSYEARVFGVHSAQPISQAWRKCPAAVYLRPDMDKYAHVSDCIMSILQDFSDLTEQVSIDEAFLDVTGSQRLFGSGDETARAIKRKILDEQHLTASVGVASNKFVAKIASDLKKPDGLVIVDPGLEREFLAPLPIRRLWGVGGKTEERLRSLGLETIGHLAALSREDVCECLGQNGEQLWFLAQGLDDRPVVPDQGFKSIGHEITFDRDTADPILIHKTLLDLTERVSQRLRENRVRARTITLKFRDADFNTCTRRTTLSTPADTTEKIFPVISNLLSSLGKEDCLVRLLGVYAGNLETGVRGEQLSLFPAGRDKDSRLAAALDDIVGRFGDRAITRAALVDKKGKVH